MNITLTVTATPELLSVLQALVPNTNAAPAKVNGAKVERKQPVKQEEPASTETDSAVQTANEIINQKDEKPEVKAVTIEQVRAVVKSKSDAGKRDELKKLLSDFGADKVTSLQKGQYADFFTKVEAL